MGLLASHQMFESINLSDFGEGQTLTLTSDTHMYDDLLSQLIVPTYSSWAS